MKNPTTELVALAVIHLGEISDGLKRAALLDAAARLLEAHGETRTANQALAAAALLREADSAQLRLTESFQQALT